MNQERAPLDQPMGRGSYRQRSGPDLNLPGFDVPVGRPRAGSRPCLDARCHEVFSDGRKRNIHYEEVHLPQNWGDVAITMPCLVILARELGLEGDPLDALRNCANDHRLAVTFKYGPPSDRWLDSVKKFTVATHSRALRKNHIDGLPSGNMLHEGLVILPRIMAGLMNLLSREGYGKCMEVWGECGKRDIPQASSMEMVAVDMSVSGSEGGSLGHSPLGKMASAPAADTAISTSPTGLITQSVGLVQQLPLSMTGGSSSPTPSPLVATVTSPSQEIVDAHWHPDRMIPPYAMQGQLAQYLELWDRRPVDVDVKIIGGVAVYCDDLDPPLNIRDPGWVNAKGVHPKQVHSGMEDRARSLIIDCAQCNWAIGEIGLNYSVGSTTNWAHQREFLFAAATMRGPKVMPLILHLRGAQNDLLACGPTMDCIAALEEAGLPKWHPLQLHCFHGGPEEGGP